jgi:pyruvate/2-oxoglutarate dehydrogenase complex dihydrolipoamide acyltransferase (E2) component
LRLKCDLLVFQSFAFSNGATCGRYAAARLKMCPTERVEVGEVLVTLADNAAAADNSSSSRPAVITHSPSSAAAATAAYKIAAGEADSYLQNMDHQQGDLPSFGDTMGGAAVQAACS